MTLSIPAMADVKAGVDAWSAGDFAAAVGEWREPAAEGDPDAQFNMAQAYRLGRGVETDVERAESFYAKAAAQGHIQAADNYGLLLFQDGRRQAAMPYVTAAAERGDPRAQYLVGIAHFNGDFVSKDWVRAYALLTLANASGLPQAGPAISQMDDFIPLEQRQAAQVVAQTLKQQAEAERAQQLAAADLGVGPAINETAPQARPMAAAQPEQQSQTALAQRPVAPAAVPPLVAAAQSAVSEAARVTGTESPATAGADFARPAGESPSGTRTAVAANPAPRDTPSAAPESADGPWRVQLGAFGVSGNADRLWTRLSGNTALAGKQKFVVPSGNVVKLQAGGYASRSNAQTACNALKRGGQDCLVTR